MQLLCKQDLKKIHSTMPKTLIQYDQWLSTDSSQTDKVCINDLAVNAMAGLDCWRRKREQTVYISLTLSFKGEFFTASTKDVVDQSTVHYGKLGKSITTIISEKSKAQEWLSSGDLAALVEEATQQTAGDPSLISTCIVDLSYPKGSLYGERAGYRYCVAYNADAFATTLYLENIRVPILLGVNDYERKKKQLVVANIWLDRIDREAIDDHTALEETFIKVREYSLFSLW